MQIMGTYARLYVDELDPALTLLASLLGEPPANRFSYGELELATVGSVLVLAGSEEALRPYRETQATMIVDDLDEVLTFLSEHGATVIAGPDEVPTGRNLTARHGDGAVVEYVQLASGDGRP
jgi:predicted enzyme related to lactoylglutathione lyase